MKLVDAYKNLETIQHQYEDLKEQKDDLDLEATSLRSKIKLLEDKLQILEGVSLEKKDLENQLVDSRVKLAEYDRLQIEHAALQENWKSTNTLLNERVSKLLSKFHFPPKHEKSIFL